MVEHIVTHPRCALFAFMGAGKSVTTLTAVDILMLADGVTRTLVVGPLRVARDVWATEAAKWAHLAHLRIVAVVGTLAERLAALTTPADIYTTNPEQVPWLVEHLGARFTDFFQMVVLDELTKWKSARIRQGGKRAQSLLKVIHGVKRVVGLTGTPAPNGLMDLYGQMLVIDRGQRLGRTHTAFVQRWFRARPGGDPRYPKLEPMAHAQEEIQSLLRDVCLTVDAKDHFDLAAPVVNTLLVDLPPAARKHYLDMEKALFVELEGHPIEAFSAAAKSQKLLQFCAGAAYVGGSNTEWVEVHDAKVQALQSIVEEAMGAPILVAYNFRSDLARLKKAFPEGADLATRDGMAKFKAGDAPLGFGHPAGMGHGVDGLQHACNTIAFFGCNWNLEEHLQVVERVGPVRQKQAGYNRPVFVHQIVARDTVDEMVLERIATKREVQDILMSAMKRRKEKPCSTG